MNFFKSFLCILLPLGRLMAADPQTLSPPADLPPFSFELDKKLERSKEKTREETREEINKEPRYEPKEVLKEEPREDHFFYNLMQMLTSLGLLVALVLLVSYFLKKMLNTRVQQMNEHSSIKILERRALSPKTTVFLLEIRNKSIVIAESLNGVTLLSPSIQEEERESFEMTPVDIQ